MTIRRSPLRPLTTAALAVALAACGGSDAGETPGERGSGSQSQGAIDACALLQQGEIEAATGVAPGPGDPGESGQPAPAMCYWRQADGGLKPVASLLITGSPIRTWDEFTRMTEEGMGADYVRQNIRRLEGPGLFAAWLDELKMIQVFDGSRMVQVSTEPAEGKDPVEAASRLASTVLERLR